MKKSDSAFDFLNQQTNLILERFSALAAPFSEQPWFAAQKWNDKNHLQKHEVQSACLMFGITSPAKRIVPTINKWEKFGENCPISLPLLLNSPFWSSNSEKKTLITKYQNMPAEFRNKDIRDYTATDAQPLEQFFGDESAVKILMAVSIAENYLNRFHVPKYAPDQKPLAVEPPPKVAENNGIAFARRPRHATSMIGSLTPRRTPHSLFV
ncbi:MAG: hypothetical protein ABTQ34_03465 [Bdellovibrionales bacterium]